jgi:hypothetical protein
MDDDRIFAEKEYTQWDESLEFQFKLFKDFYHRGLEWRDRLEASLSLPATVIVVLAGALGLFMDKASTLSNIYAEICFLLLSGVVAIFIIGAIYHLIKAVNPEDYRYLPDPDDYLEIAGDIGDEVLSRGEEKVTEQVVNALKHQLYDLYYEIGQHNEKINETVRTRRAHCINWTIMGMIGIFVCFFLLGIVRPLIGN